MKIVLKKGDEIISTPIPADDVMVRPKKKPDYKKTNGLVVKISGGRAKVENKKEEEIVTPPVVENKQTNPEEAKAAVNAEVETTNNEVKSEETVPPVVEEDNSDSDKEVEFYTKSNFIKDKEDETADESNVETTEDEKKNESSDETSKAEVESEPDPADGVKPGPAPAKKTTAKKTTTTKKVVNTKPEVETTATTDTDDLESKYAQYDVDDEPSYQPIRKKKSSVERDANGRFVSSGNGKKKTNRIPSK